MHGFASLCRCEAVCVLVDSSCGFTIDCGVYVV